jgi:glycosyltransferase involved in cell wall biosynthesis
MLKTDELRTAEPPRLLEGSERFSILHLLNGFGDSSISRIVYRIIENLAGEEYDWHVGGLGGTGTMRASFEDLGARTVDFSLRAGSRRWAWQRIRRYAIDHEIKLVHTHTPRTILQAALAARSLPDVVHVATKHLLTAPQDRAGGGILAALDRLFLYLPDRLVPVSETMAQQILVQPGMDPGRITAIRNAIPIDPYHAPGKREACRQALEIPPDALVIGFLGRMDPVKRIDLLLQAHRQALLGFPNARLLLIGEGSRRSEWQGLCSQLGISDTVIWTGFRTDVAELLSAMDIYVQPSVNEGLSLSILEAMAAGKPVIATEVGGAREVITDQVTGRLVPPGSFEAIRDAIVDLLANAEKRRSLGQAARAHVARAFGVQRMVSAYGDLYARLAARAGSQRPESVK